MTDKSIENEDCFETLEELLPRGKPMQTADEMKEMEEKLEDPTIRRGMSIVLASMAGGGSLSQAGRAIMRLLMSNSIMSLYSYRGQKSGNKPFKDTRLCKVVLYAMKRCSKSSSQTDIRFEVAEVLRNAPNLPGGANHEKKRAMGQKRKSGEEDTHELSLGTKN